jgi:hypothetical protein
MATYTEYKVVCNDPQALSQSVVDKFVGQTNAAVFRSSSTCEMSDSIRAGTSTAFVVHHPSKQTEQDLVSRGRDGGG